MTNKKTKAQAGKVPASAKQPQDRQPKQQKPAEVDLGDSVTFTLRGVEVTVEVAAMDDFELLDDISQMEQGDATRMPSVLRRMVGDKYHELLETCRDKETGRVSIEAGGQLVYDVLERLDPNS